jgi:hypothetical protein
MGEEEGAVLRLFILPPELARSSGALPLFWFLMLHAQDVTVAVLPRVLHKFLSTEHPSMDLDLG